MSVSSSAALVTPVRRVQGRLQVPGDKSIAHRYALIGALSDGTSHLTNYAPGADCHSTLRCLAAVGVGIEESSAGSITIVGRDLGDWRQPSAPLDAGNSGTTMRMLMGPLAASAIAATLVGDESLSRRPMRRAIEPLVRMGARIKSTDGHAPLTVHGGPLNAIRFQPTVPSAQVKSAVLLAGLHAAGHTSVTESAATRDHTERALMTFGYDVERSGLTTTVWGRQRGQARTLSIPGDFSSAAFWLVAAAALPGSRIQIDDVGLNPTRTALLDVLRRYGARVTVHSHAVEVDEPPGTVGVEAAGHGRVEVDPGEVPGLIDELPAVAALAAQQGEVIVRGAAELRVKESDRIAVLVAGFRALGIEA